jgi:hypothetical protein
MAIVRSTRKAGSELTPEQIARLDAAAKRPPVYDPECPPLTDEQLAEFQPVYFDTWEERNQYMREHETARAPVSQSSAKKGA